MHDLLQALHKKSEQLNLFSAGDREKLERKHFPDALAALELWKPLDGEAVADIGTGGGIPGLVLAYECPAAEFVLMDAREKKARAVEDVAHQVGLKNARGVAGRLEDLGHEKNYRESFDTVTARALAPLPTLLEYAAGFLKVNGQFLAWKSRNYAEELQASENAQETLNLHFEEAYDYTLPDGEARSILVFLKTDKTSAKFPRRAPLPKDKPL